jgi:hypothetical protein
LNRRQFARKLLLATGELALLNSSPQLIAASLRRSPEDRVKASGSLSVEVGKTVEITRSFSRCWFPTVYQFPNKDLMAAMSMSPDEVNPESDFNAYCISKDNGETWSRRYTMGSGAAGDGAWLQNPGPDGAIWGIGDRADLVSPGNRQDFYLVRTRLSKSGMTIDVRRDIPLHMSEPIQMNKPLLYDRHLQDTHLAEVGTAMPFGPILPSGTGTLIAPLYYKSDRDPRYYRLACIRSEDNGSSWREGAIIAGVEHEPWPGMGEEGPCEAGMVRLQDGRLFTIFRTGGKGFMGTVWSSDEGKTWTSPISTPFKGVAPRVRRLSNGILACSTGRPGPVVLMFSLDGTGQSWSHVTPIFTGTSTHYTDFVEIAPGKLFLIYDSIPHGWDEIPLTDQASQNIIYGTYLDVELR